MYKQLVTILISILISGSLGWWDSGHLVTTQIAKNELLKRNPKLFKFIEDLTLFGTELSAVPVTDFVSSGSWADDIKGKGLNVFDNWHYINQPFNVDGSFVNHNGVPGNNLLWALKKTEDNLNNKRTLGKLTLEKSLMLKYFVHLVSDLHQPLHTAGLFNASLIDGDLGGNKFNISENFTKNYLTNLHSFWDSGAGFLPQFKSYRPYSNQFLEEIQNFTENLTKELPRESLQQYLGIINYTSIMKESYFIAKEYAYGPLLSQAQEVINITNEYRLSTYEITKRQLALSGYRLTDKLIQIFEPQLYNRTFIETKLNELRQTSFT